MAANESAIRKDLDIEVGNAVMKIARKLGASSQGMNQAIETIMQDYHPFFLKPKRFYSDFQKGIIFNHTVTPAEYIGHALRKPLGKAYQTFEMGYNREEAIPDLKEIIKAMVYYSKCVIFWIGGAASDRT